MTPLSEEYFTIPLTRGLSALVSPEDYPLVSRFKWYAMKTKGKFYAVRKSSMKDGKRRQILMHRYLLGLHFGDKRQGDHADNTATLDNRRSNIRIATCTQNSWNSAMKTYNNIGLKGVSIDKKASALHPYRARITVDRKQILIGYFAAPELAHEAYIIEAKKRFGEFARSA